MGSFEAFRNVRHYGHGRALELAAGCEVASERFLLCQRVYALDQQSRLFPGVKIFKSHERAIRVANQEMRDGEIGRSFILPFTIADRIFYLLSAIFNI
jgi:hypothetical protein